VQVEVVVLHTILAQVVQVVQVVVELLTLLITHPPQLCWVLLVKQTLVVVVVQVVEVAIKDTTEVQAL
jgi:hypothetical protein